MAFGRGPKPEVQHVEVLHSPDESELSRRGEALQEKERDISMGKTISQNWRSILFCLASFFSAIIYGYDNMVNGASLSMPALMLYFGEMTPTGPILPAVWTSLWSAMSSLAAALGAFIAGFLMDRFGRKWIGCASACLTLVGTGIQYAALTRGTLLAGKVIGGLGIGASLAAGTAYASEVAPLKLRGPIQQGIALSAIFAFGLGQAVIRIFITDIRESAFRNVFAIQWAPGAAAAIVWVLVPESPVYLVTRDRLDAAKKSMARIYGADNSIDERTAVLFKTVREEQLQRNVEAGSYLDCFRGTDLKRTLTAIFIYTAPNWAGAAFLAQGVLVLIYAGLPAVHVFDIGVGGWALAMVIIVMTWVFGHRFKKNNAVILGCGLNVAFMAVIGAMYYAPGSAPLWTAGILVNLATSSMTSMIQGMGYPIAAEVSTLRLRGKTMSLTTITQALSAWLTQFVVPYMYNQDAGGLQLRTAFIWAGSSVLLTGIAWWLLPDTQNLTPEEIDNLYSIKTPPRKFQEAAHRSRHVTIEKLGGEVDAA